eukprot:8541340-Lingulodinium_polyedra.AAC.1
MDSAAAPRNLQQKLFRRWYMKWARYNKKNDLKGKLKRVKDELRTAFQGHRATAIVGELRAM